MSVALQRDDGSCISGPLQLETSDFTFIGMRSMPIMSCQILAVACGFMGLGYGSVMALAWAMPRLRRTRCRLARMFLVIVMPQHSLLLTHRKRERARQFAIQPTVCSGCTDSNRRAGFMFPAARARFERANTQGA